MLTTARNYQRYDDDDDYDPHEFRQVPKPTGNFATLIHIMKACVGAGILAMPFAFSLVGSIAGCLGVLFVGFMCGYAIYLLINSTYRVCKLTKTPHLTYGDTMRAAIAIGPPKFQKFSDFGGILVDSFFVLYHIGVCGVYIVFIIANVKDVVDEYKEINIYIYFLVAFIPFALTPLVKNLKAMVPVSLMANVIQFTALGICLYYVFQDMPNFTDLPMFKPPNQYPLFLSIATYAMQSLGVVIVTENNMKYPKDFLHGACIFYIAQGSTMLLYFAIGFFGYWKFGEDSKPSLTLNLPHGDLASKFAKLLMAMAIYGTFSLKMYPGIITIWQNYIVRRINEDQYLLYDCILRYSIFLFVYILAVAVPMLDLIISLVQSVCFSSLGFIFPPLIDCLAKYPDKYGCCKWIMVKNGIVILVGLLFFFMGTYLTMLQIAQRMADVK